MPIHTRFNLVASGRTSSSNPNLQNQSKGHNIRECFVPRPGKLFLQADYDGLELRTMAQVCLTLFKKSALAEALNSGKDPHLLMAAQLLKKEYEWCVENKKLPEVKRARGLAKVANFGFPGGLGPKRLVEYARVVFGIEITESESVVSKQIWLETWQEMRLYLNRINTLGFTSYRVEQLYTKRIRGGMTYTAACNTYFQGLGADATQNALWRITVDCYTNRDSVLFGCRPVVYVHDEFILEIPEDLSLLHERGERLVELMCSGANEFLKDVPATTSPVAMRFWSKDAEARYENGRLAPWPS